MLKLDGEDLKLSEDEKRILKESNLNPEEQKLFVAIIISRKVRKIAKHQKVKLSVMENPEAFLLVEYGTKAENLLDNYPLVEAALKKSRTQIN